MNNAGIVEMAVLTLLGRSVSIEGATDILKTHITLVENTLISAINSMGRMPTGEEKKIETRGRPVGSAKEKIVDDEKQQLLYCQALNGTIDGGTCLYHKYEVTPTGRATEYEVGVPLVQLRQSNVDGQYSPSKDSWIATKSLNEEAAIGI